eukprot:COSAG05_NODE_18226_length_311_cov_1.457547_1_plen_34_part_01
MTAMTNLQHVDAVERESDRHEGFVGPIRVGAHPV